MSTTIVRRGFRELAPRLIHSARSAAAVLACAAVPALAHRLTLRPELWVQRVRAEDVVSEVLDAVATPRAEYTELRRPGA